MKKKQALWISFHPSLIPYFLFLYSTGQISYYSMLFLSLLLHEMGHLLAAKLFRFRFSSCIIYPYGGELVLDDFELHTRIEKLAVIVAGPFVTFCIWMICSSTIFPGNYELLQIQTALLCLNALPIYPLDGGRFLQEYFHLNQRSFYSFSLLFSVLLIGMSLYYSPFYSIIFIVLAIQNAQKIRHFRFEKAFQEIVLKKLT